MPGRIYSVGYEGLEVSGLVERLRWSGVALLIDVRLNAVSRKPGWSKTSLRAALEASGIEYRHDPELGNPPGNRDSFRRGNREDGRRKMREILSNGSERALRQLVEDTRDRRIAVLCVERSPQHCHRQVITNMAQEIDPTLEVIPIL